MNKAQQSIEKIQHQVDSWLAKRYGRNTLTQSDLLSGEHPVPQTHLDIGRLWVTSILFVDLFRSLQKESYTQEILPLKSKDLFGSVSYWH